MFLNIIKSSLNQVMVKNLEEIPVKSVYDAIQLFQKGMNERKTSTTNYNERSRYSFYIINNIYIYETMLYFIIYF